MAHWIKPGLSIDFIGRRRRFAILSILAVIASLATLVVNWRVRGSALNYGTDFKGGTQLQVLFAKPLKAAQVRSTLSGAGYKNAEVVQMDDGQRKGLFMLRLTEVAAFSEEQQRQVKAALQEAFGDKLKRFDYKSGSDRIRLQFARGAKVAPDAEPDAEPTPTPTSQPAKESAAGGAVANASPTSQPAAAGAGVKGGDSAASKKARSGATRERADLKRIREVVAATGVGVQTVTQPGRSEDNRYEVLLSGLGEDIRKAFDAALGAGSIADIPQVESVGAKMGQQLRDDGIKSVVYALLLMLVYIAFRFDFRYAPGAVIALAHDVIVTTGLFALAWAEFSLPVVAALLTIAGYSINDTIVVFDRIRENVTRLRDRKFPLVVNASLNETLSRTLLTSLTTLFTCVAIWVLGTGVLRTFAFALTAGVLIGTYSSLFIASPIVVAMNERLAGKGRR